MYIDETLLIIPFMNIRYMRLYGIVSLLDLQSIITVTIFITA